MRAAAQHRQPAKSSGHGNRAVVGDVQGLEQTFHDLTRSVSVRDRELVHTRAELVQREVTVRRPRCEHVEHVGVALPSEVDEGTRGAPTGVRRHGHNRRSSSNTTTGLGRCTRLHNRRRGNVVATLSRGHAHVDVRVAVRVRGGADFVAVVHRASIGDAGYKHWHGHGDGVCVAEPRQHLIHIPRLLRGQRACRALGSSERLVDDGGCCLVLRQTKLLPHARVYEVHDLEVGLQPRFQCTPRQ